MEVEAADRNKKNKERSGKEGKQGMLERDG